MDNVKNLTILAYKSDNEDSSSRFDYRIFPIDEYGVTTTDINDPAAYIFNLKQQSAVPRLYDFTFLFDGRELESEEEDLFVEGVKSKVRELEKRKYEKIKKEQEALALEDAKLAEQAERAYYETLKKKFEGSTV